MPGGQGGAPGLDDRLGRGEVRLADLQVDHIVAGGLQLVGPRQQAMTWKGSMARLRAL